MNVWQVMQVVARNHNTSYKVGKNWMESCDTEREAITRADLMNQHRSTQCIGVSYIVAGPMPEQHPVQCDHNESTVARGGSTGMFGVVRCQQCGFEREWNAY
jgi:hypothetical protein